MAATKAGMFDVARRLVAAVVSGEEVRPTECSVHLLARAHALREVADRLDPALLPLGVGDRKGRFEQEEKCAELARVMVDGDDAAFIAHLGRFIGDGSDDPDYWMVWPTVAEAHATLGRCVKEARKLIVGDPKEDAVHTERIEAELAKVDAVHGYAYVDDAGRQRTVDAPALRKAVGASGIAPATIAGHVSWLVDRASPPVPESQCRSRNGRIFAALSRRMETAT